MDRYLWEILLVLGLILLNGYFAAAEIALISARRTSLQGAAEHGSVGARAALQLTEDPSRLLATVQLGMTFVGFMASATAAVSLGVVIDEWLRSLPVPGLANIASGLSVFLVTVVVAYVTLVLGELTPKRLGLRYADRVASSVARPVIVLARVLAPAVWLLRRSSDAVAWLLRIEPGGKPGVTEEEIKLLVTEQGSLLPEEKRMIHEVFELGDTVAREVMVPRVDAVMVADPTPLTEVLEVFGRTGFSRLPVYHDDPDTVVGVLLLKDIVVGPNAGHIEGRAAADVMRPPFFVPETKPVLPLLAEMRATRSHLAVVVDEYGGTSGLVTIEDILEEVVGEIADEFDRDRERIREVVPGEWVVDGRLSVEDAREMLGLDLPDSEEYDTVAGWVLMKLGHIPASGETLEVGGYTVRVAAVRRRRIVRLVVRRRDAATPGA